MSLIVRPWPMDVPCHTHNCGQAIQWGIVPKDAADDVQAIVAGVCDDCLLSLYRSIEATRTPATNEPDLAEAKSEAPEPVVTARTRGRRSAVSFG